MNLSLIIFSVLHVDVAVVVPGGDFHKVYLKPTQTAAIKKKCKLLLFCEPLHCNISMHILHTVLYTFPWVLTRRICFINKSFISW